MSTSISPPPERELPPGHHVRRRQQLVNLAQSDGRPARRRFWVPMAAAASVVALVAAGAVAVQALRPDGTPKVAGTSHATTKSTPKPTTKSTPKPTTKARSEQPAKPAIPHLTTHEITGAALQQFYDDCVRKDQEMADQSGEAMFEGFDRPLFAFSVDMPRGPSYPKIPSESWLVAIRGDGSRVDDRALCTRRSKGEPFPTGAMLSHEPKGDGYLYQIVAGGAEGAGFVMPQVKAVTFEPKLAEGPETYAVVRDGMWFYPEFTPLPDGSDIDDPDTWPENKLIRVPDAHYRYRGYDADGKLIYDSERDGPFVSECYTDPAGKEVIVVNSVKNPTPETCNRTYEWTAP